MKKIYGLLLALLPVLGLTVAKAQEGGMVEQPVTWQCTYEHVENDIYEVVLKGVIEDQTWHIYDMAEYEYGPVPTELKVTPANKYVKVEGEPYIKSEVHRAYDDIWGFEIGTMTGNIVIAQKVKVSDAKKAAASVYLSWQACDEGHCVMGEQDFNIGFTGDGTVSEKQMQELSAAETAAPAAQKDSKSLWLLILQAIGWGFIMLLTPCVFPMVPMTVSFFLKQNQKQGSNGKLLASFFGLSIVALYTLPIAIIILITYFAGGDAVTADIFNFLATHWIPNILFFIIFMIFAASFFGAFEIVMPSKLVNKADNSSNKGGLVGVFFMALTLVLVSFSCTGPIVGTVLIQSTQGGVWDPIITMFAFSVAFALPFTVFAFAPSLLKNLPKSGGWLNSVKVTLGFIEVALGFKFLSVADQTYHWGLLDREVYLAIWIVCFTLLGFYLLGKLNFKLDSPVKYVSVTRLSLAIVSFTFVVYMLPGMWGAPLKALSGYLPPITTQDFVIPTEGVAVSTGTQTKVTSAKYSDFLHLPHGIQGYFHYGEAIEAAKAAGKPLFIDFTGHGCVNCRDMEARVWSDPRVLQMLRNDYVVLALYADDKYTVPEEDWVVTEDGKTLKQLGRINSHFAMKRFNVNAQPYYVLINPYTEEQLTQSRGYDLNVEAFVKFLEDGKANMKK